MNCHEFVIISRENGGCNVHSTFVNTDSLKKFDEGLPRTLPTIPAKIRTRFTRACEEYVLDESHRFKDFISFKDFFENDIDDTHRDVARRLIDAVLKDLEPIHEDVTMTDGFPKGITVVSRSTRLANFE